MRFFASKTKSFRAKKGNNAAGREPLHRGDEAIAATRDVDDVSRHVARVAERTTQRRDVDAQVALLDVGLRPGAGEQVVLADQLSGAPDQGRENGQGTAADADRPAVESEGLPGERQFERPERIGRAGCGVASTVSREVSSLVHEDAPPLPSSCAFARSEG